MLDWRDSFSPHLQQEVQASGGGKKDDRSVEALLQFIDGAAGSKKSKSKKKKKKGKRDEAEDHTSEDVSSSPLRNLHLISQFSFLHSSLGVQFACAEMGPLGLV